MPIPRNSEALQYALLTLAWMQYREKLDLDQIHDVLSTMPEPEIDVVCRFLEALGIPQTQEKIPNDVYLGLPSTWNND